MAQGGRLGCAAPRLAGAAGRGRASGLAPGGAGQRQRARQKGGDEVGPNPTGRGKPGTKRHPVVDARGTLFGVTLSGANRHDSMALAATLDAIPPVRPGGAGQGSACAARGMPAEGSGAARGGARASCTPTRPTTTGAAAANAASAGSRRASPAWRREQPEVGTTPLGDRAHLRLAGTVPAPERALRTPGRHPSCLHHARLRPRLPEPDQAVLLGALTPARDDPDSWLLPDAPSV